MNQLFPEPVLFFFFVLLLFVLKAFLKGSFEVLWGPLGFVLVLNEKQPLAAHVSRTT